MDVAIYSRLSQEDADARAGEATATARQIADCRAFAETQGWRVVAVYEDPDHSASNPRRKRPDFERMLADLSDGVHVDRVLCYKVDRLLRQPKEAERIIDLADQRGFGIVSLNDPSLDLTTPTGRAMFRMTITWAKLETETMSLRIRRKAKDIAETGRPNGGGIRSFGLTADKSRLRPTEAALIREAATRALAGETLHSIAVDWNKRGVRTPAGRKWESSSLKRMITAPRIVGDRAHHGVVVGGGVIPAILPRETWERVRAVLEARSDHGSHSPVRRHFLTGLVYCGRCGAKLVARPDWKGQTRYVCAPPRGCGGITIAKSNIEPLITEAIFTVAGPGFAERTRERTERDAGAADLDQLRKDQSALEEAAEDYYVKRKISKPEFQTVRARLEDRIATARRRIESASSTAGLSRLAGLDLRAEWEKRPATWQNEVARLLIDRITINPAPRRGTRFDPSRVDVDWRDS